MPQKTKGFNMAQSNVKAPATAPATAPQLAPIALPQKGQVTVAKGQAIIAHGFTFVAPCTGATSLHKICAGWPQVGICQNGHAGMPIAHGNAHIIASNCKLAIAFCIYCANCNVGKGMWHVWVYGPNFFAPVAK
jgi:hypothetical protein